MTVSLTLDTTMHNSSTTQATMATAAKNKNIPPTTERIDRTSFSSIKESHVGGVAQNFTISKTSSYLRNQLSSFDGEEEAISDDSSSGSKTPEEKVREPGKGMMTNPHSALHGFVCPCDGFRGWKGIAVRGKLASKSFSDLKGLGNRWDWETRGGDIVMGGTEDAKIKLLRGRYPPGQSLLELLPMELLGTIIDQLATDIPPNGFTARNIDLMSLLLTSRGIHAATLATLYSQITIPHSRIFAKFLAHIRDHPSLGTIVRRLDFSHFNPTGAGMSARERAQTLNLIPATLLQCIELTPNLREFLAQEHIDDDLDVKVIETLLCTLPKLKALDFTACSSPSFRTSFTTVIETSPLPSALPITRLSLHECTNLPTTVFTTLLPKLTHLTHLDVSHTRITDTALHSIPRTAQLTHLNLSKCANLTGDSVVEFLATHPAVKTLLYLNLSMDSKSHEMLTSEHLTELIPHLPSTLRSLSLKGSKMDSAHIPLLLPLTKHLEELGLGRHLKLKDLLNLFVPHENLALEEQLSWVPHTLHYIDVSDLSVPELDLGGMFSTSCPLLKSITEPLEVIEVSPEVMKRLDGLAALKRVGWCVKELGRRGWMVRNAVDGKTDSGERGWKWGATFWGMKKIPVARAEVGGMFAHYMFKR